MYWHFAAALDGQSLDSPSPSSNGSNVLGGGKEWLEHPDAVVVANAAAALGKNALHAMAKERKEKGELLESAQASWASVLLKDISHEERNESLYKTMKLLENVDDPKALGFETNVLVCTSETDLGAERNAEALARREELSERYPEQAEALETPRRKNNAVLTWNHRVNSRSS